MKFDDTYLDIINSAKVDISVGRNSTDRDSRLKAIQKIIGETVYYDNKKDEFYLKKRISSRNLTLWPKVFGKFTEISFIWARKRIGKLFMR